MDTADIYYQEFVLKVMHGEPDAAIDLLQAAYDRGFRGNWVLEIDARVDAVRDHPGFVAIQQQIRDDVNRARAEVRALAAL